MWMWIKEMHFMSDKISKRKNISTGRKRENLLQMSLALHPLRAMHSESIDPSHLSKTLRLIDPFNRIQGTGFITITSLKRFLRQL